MIREELMQLEELLDKSFQLLYTNRLESHFQAVSFSGLTLRKGQLHTIHSDPI